MAIPRIGEICTCCSTKDQMKKPENAGRSPRRLSRIGSNLTQNKSLMVIGCEWCDSDIIYKLAQKSTKE